MSGDVVKQVFRGENVTVYSGFSEVIVYGEGSDWYVQYSRVTNHVDGWRKWFAYRDWAERDAATLASEPYSGKRFVKDSSNA